MLKFTTNIWVHRQRNVDYEILLNMQIVYNNQFNAPPVEFGRLRQIKMNDIIEDLDHNSLPIVQCLGLIKG